MSNLIRLIPLILLKDGNVVQSYGFSDHPIIGQPKYTLKRMLDYQADELVVLDISSKDGSTSRTIDRNDLAHQSGNYVGLESILTENSGWLLFPLAVGGGIRSIEQAGKLISLGADKIVMNSALRKNPNLVRECSSSFGAQATVVSIDVVEIGDGFGTYDHENHVVDDRPNSLLDEIEKAQKLGAGELLINNVTRDGKRKGLNLELLDVISKISSVPVIAAGGAGSHLDFSDASNSGVSAVAASNFFHSHELSYPKLKKAIVEVAQVRPFGEESRFIRRDSDSDKGDNAKFVISRISQALEAAKNYQDLYNDKTIEFKRCKSCLYPLNSATSIYFDSKNICSGCIRTKELKSMDESESIGIETLTRIVSDARSRNSNNKYDCVIAVSGGKDSYFQTHFIKHELGLNPLLVTYDANNWTETGIRNMERMSSVFSVDHEIIAPDTELLAKMNLLGLVIMGDMSWHAHVGIATAPMRVAASRGIPLVFYGEHGREDLSGQFRFGDFPEVTYRERTEHHARGYDWTRFSGLMNINDGDLQTWAYPSDLELLATGVRGLHLGSFIDWDPHSQTQLVKEKYGFKTSPVKYDRTYRLGSNLDDMHENGVHDWLKYVKFGYGRATDHGSRDIRLGTMKRSETLSLAKQLDSTLPNDLSRWLGYTQISKNLFFLLANFFRSPNVWTYENGAWLHPEGMQDNWTPEISSQLLKEVENLTSKI